MILPNEILCLELIEECFLRVCLEWGGPRQVREKGGAFQIRGQHEGHRFFEALTDFGRIETCHRTLASLTLCL